MIADLKTGITRRLRKLGCRLLFGRNPDGTQRHAFGNPWDWKCWRSVDVRLCLSCGMGIERECEHAEDE